MVELWRIPSPSFVYLFQISYLVGPLPSPLALECDKDFRHHIWRLWKKDSNLPPSLVCWLLTEVVSMALLRMRELAPIHVLMCVTFLVSGLCVNALQFLLYILLAKINRRLFR